MKTVLSSIVCLLALAAPAVAQPHPAHLELVQQVRADLVSRGVPVTTIAGAFEIVKRVAWTLRGEGAGLLLKSSGDNIIIWREQSFSAGRMCYSDGTLVKLLTDVPSTNGPSWQDNGTIDPKLCVPAMNPDDAPVPPQTPPPPPAPIFDGAALDTAIANLRADFDDYRQEFKAFSAEVHNWKAQLGEFVTKYILPELGTILATLKLTGKI